MEGIVTLEDVLEEIVGEIEDEFDLPDTSIERIDEKHIRIDGTYTIDDFNEEFGTELEQEDFHTMAGLVFGELGRAPEVGRQGAGRRALPQGGRGRGLADPEARGRVRRGREPPPTSPKPPRLARMSAPGGSAFRHRDFALFFVAQVTEALALTMATVAIGWQVYSVRENPLDLALVALAEFLPLPLLALPAGHLADRLPRRTLAVDGRARHVVVLGGLLAVTRGRARDGLAVLRARVRPGRRQRDRRACGPRAHALARAAGDPRERARAALDRLPGSAVVAGPAIGGILFAIEDELVYIVGIGLSLVALGVSRFAAGGCPRPASVAGSARCSRAFA